MSQVARGAVRSEEAYALGKMLDNSAWNGILPRKITPSDIDLIFDNNGRMIFAELSSTHGEWRLLTIGQQLAYINAITLRPHCAVLCKHSVRPEHGRKIDTLKDIESFQIMLFYGGPVCSTVFRGAELWKRFVLGWHADAKAAFFRCLLRTEPLVMPS